MGEIAEMMLEGILDEQTGEYIGEAVGYPRTRQKGFYNSIGKKTRRNIKHALKGQSLGGLHLVGKEIETLNNGKCLIKAYGGKRGKKRYTVIDERGNEVKLKFSQFVFKALEEKNKATPES